MVPSILFFFVELVVDCLLRDHLEVRVSPFFPVVFLYVAVEPPMIFALSVVPRHSLLFGFWSSSLTVFAGLVARLALCDAFHFHITILVFLP